VFEQVKAIADKAVETYGRLDTWVHTPAIAIFASFSQTSPEEFQRIINVSLMGQVYGAMAALPYLKREGRGALIHISSIEGQRSLPLQSAYRQQNTVLKVFWSRCASSCSMKKFPSA
jgi:NAD(P)-dependent dehydrogenase (short-subunit alcohol dehydrogenase family)